MFHVEHYLFISVFIINSIFSTWNIIYLSPLLLSTTSLSFLLYYYFPGNISMFHVEHYLFIFDFIINYISFFLLQYYFPKNISMFHVEHYLFISALLSTTSFSFYFNIISREIILYIKKHL